MSSTSFFGSTNNLFDIYPHHICSALETPQYYSQIWIFILCSAIFPLFFVSAPYGKLKNATYTIDVNPKLGWFLMEAPAWITYILISFLALPEILSLISTRYTTPGSNRIPSEIGLWIVLYIISASLYCCHYFYRSIIYPQLCTSSKPMDLFAALLATVFNIANGIMHTHNIFCVQLQQIGNINLTLIISGNILFILCWLSCYWSDMHLISLRGKVARNTSLCGNTSNTQYVIPTKGFFKYLYTPNYLFEFLQWISFVLVTQFAWSSILFAILTFCNLFPRTVDYSKFYKKLAIQQKFQNTTSAHKTE